MSTSSQNTRGNLTHDQIHRLEHLLHVAKSSASGQSGENSHAHDSEIFGQDQYSQESNPLPIPPSRIDHDYINLCDSLIEIRDDIKCMRSNATLNSMMKYYIEVYQYNKYVPKSMFGP